jgi:2-oxoglutarate ferredoxin oxidoreductase subunit beta
MAVTKIVPSTIYGTNSFCPGCGHGIVIRILAETIEEMGLASDAIGVLAVGCSCLTNRMLAVDLLQAAHGRASASAAGIKRCKPNKLVFTYQGDGDAASIGIAETIYSAQRNENITQIIVNNGVYGMTGGQMSPTTLVGQKTTTSPQGRDPAIAGMPLKIAEMLANFPITYLARGSVHTAAAINKTKTYINKAFTAQMEGQGYTCVEIISPCPTNWHLSPLESLERIEREVADYYPLGELQTGKAN